MSDQIHDYYQSKKNCLSSIHTARKAFGSTTTTEEQYDQMEKTLGLMYFHCPENLQVIVQATIEEAGQRRVYFEERWNKQQMESVS